MKRGGTKILLFALALLLFACVTAIHGQSPPQPPPANPVFTDRDASTLLRQLSEALQSHSRKKLFGLFDFKQMADGPLFRQQIDALLSHSESIRVHLNLMETDKTIRADGVPDGAMAVEAEMEVQPSNGGVAWRRNERLVFGVDRVGQSWKFYLVSPSSFFSLP